MGISEGSLLLGIDGGGTSTTALLAQTQASGWVSLGRGESGPSNLAVGTRDAAWTNLLAAVTAAFDDARRQPRPVAYACCAGRQ